jgi:hypothetical protein
MLMMNGLFRRSALAMLPLLGLAHLASVAQIPVIRSFDGDQGIEFSQCRPESTRCGRQPEMNVAVNGTAVVQVTWQHVSVFDYNGKLLRSIPLAQFIKNAHLEPDPAEGKGPFEPMVIYDEFLSRWILTATCHNDCFLVSQSSDPLGAWGGIYLSCLQGGPCLERDPALHIGFDKNGVYYCGGHMGDEFPQTVPRFAYDCFAIPSSEVPGIARGTPPEHLNRTHNMPLDIVPAIDHNENKSKSAPAFFAAKTCSRDEPGGCQRSVNFPFHWIVETFTWKGSGGAYSGAESAQIIKTDIGSKQDKWLYNLPCCTASASIAQAGSGITLRAAESHRLSNLVQFGSHVYGILGSGPCTHDCGRQGGDAGNILFFVDLDCSNPAACVVAQTAKISSPDSNPEFATVGVDSQGNLGIVAESATATTDLSILLWAHRSSDPVNVFAGPVTVVAGTRPYTCLDQHNMAMIGSAVGVLTALDPADGSKLWTTQQWSKDANRCVWNTRIIQYQIAPMSSVTKKSGKQSDR